jgi:hypothetical protein
VGEAGQLHCEMGRATGAAGGGGSGGGGREALSGDILGREAARILEALPNVRVCVWGGREAARILEALPNVRGGGGC